MGGLRKWDHVLHALAAGDSTAIESLSSLFFYFFIDILNVGVQYFESRNLGYKFQVKA
jgi:hypothetical protein